VSSTDRTRAIIDRRIAIEGADVEVHVDEPHEIFRMAQRAGGLDVAEMSLCSHMMQCDAGTSEFWAIPVFLSRSFRHNAIHIRTDRNIGCAADLNGRSIGIQGFQQTGTVWVRGNLTEHYGFDPFSVQWVVGKLDARGSVERAPLRRPLALCAEVAAEGETLDSLLRAGAIDAVISPTPPACAQDASVPVALLFPETAAEERGFFARTGLFPVMHVLGLRRAVAERHPSLAVALFAGFAAAKSQAQAILLRDDYLRTSLPWQTEAALMTRQLMGSNPWRYGFAENLPELRALVRHAARDGLVAGTLGASELFHPATLALADPDGPGGRPATP
jgi:4,5-dihydroxyphthalate decarboxylase